MSGTKLIILRGPSASGKTTVARALFEKCERKTALIELDYYRFMLKPAGHLNNSQAIHELVQQDVLTCLRNGYDVILEGVLIKDDYKTVFAEFVKLHPSENYSFYFDVSLAETLRRHDTKPVATDIPYEQLKKWYIHRDELDYDFEHLLPQSMSVKVAVEKIQHVAGV